MDLVLASTSPIRRTLLTNAGVQHRVVAPGVDETAIKVDHKDGDAELATALAAAKALAVSAQAPEALVVGSDSLISVCSRRFSKPRDRDEAAEHLRFFSGEVMQLTSAVALARGGGLLWADASVASLRVRELSAAFIEQYLDAEWPEVGYCVGVFRLEGPGVQLFDQIDGDHFTILGLPLLPLLRELRRHDVLPS